MLQRLSCFSLKSPSFWIEVEVKVKEFTLSDIWCRIILQVSTFTEQTACSWTHNVCPYLQRVQIFSFCVLSLGTYFIKIPVTHNLLYMTPEEDPFFYPYALISGNCSCTHQTLHQFRFMAFTKFVIIPRLLSNEDRCTFVGSTRDNLEYSFAQDSSY
jgi:hypothetical protein